MNRRRFALGFTLIEIMIVVAIVGILAALAIPSFMKHAKKTKASEAKVQLERLYNGSKIYYETNGRFVGVSAGPTPALAAVCAGTSPQRHLANPANWTVSPWQEMAFQMNDPHIYSYAYEQTATSMSVLAVGDTNCNGVTSSFTMSAGSVTGEFSGSGLTETRPSE